MSKVVPPSGRSNVKELDQRTDGLTTVTLFYDFDLNIAVLQVDSEGTTTYTEVPGDQAWDSFNHPFTVNGGTKIGESAAQR